MKRYIKTLTLLVLSIFLGKTSNACSCTNFATIDSLPQMGEYAFIAHVKITDDQIFKKPSKGDFGATGLLKFEIIELFKGEKINQVLEYAKNSSCDIGVSLGEEWILFGKVINNKISIMPCDRNQRYKTKDEFRDWKYESGFSELKQLRVLYGHTIPKFEHEKRQEFYKNGEIEIEETYANGKLNGERKIWYPNGRLFCKQFYINDTLDGKSEWFYESGQIYDEDYYLKGKPLNVSRLYYDSTIEKGWKQMLIDDFYKTEDSLDFVYKRIQVQYETVYDSYGRAVIVREYTRLGKIYREETIDPDRKFRTVIYYHDNGLMSSIMYSLNGINFGHYQTYQKDGLPGIGWDYDENGKAILNK